MTKQRLDAIYAWRKANPDKVREINARYNEKNKIVVRMRNRAWHANNKLVKAAIHERNKEAVVNVLTNGEGTCRWCGQGDLDVLCVDHTNDDGAAYRRFMLTSNVYNWVIKNDYPGGFQVLCYNCNMKKEMQRRRAALVS